MAPPDTETPATSSRAAVQAMYDASADLVALRYRADDLRRWTEDAGFRVTRCAVEPVEDFPMDAVYLEAAAS